MTHLHICQQVWGVSPCMRSSFAAIRQWCKCWLANACFLKILLSKGYRHATLPESLLIWRCHFMILCNQSPTFQTENLGPLWPPSSSSLSVGTRCTCTLFLASINMRLLNKKHWSMRGNVLIYKYIVAAYVWTWHIVYYMCYYTQPFFFIFVNNVDHSGAHCIYSKRWDLCWNCIVKL